MTTVTEAAQSARFPLDARYTQETGRTYLTGIQALVRLPMDQHRADARRGLRTAAFISGYQGSPLGGLDLELQRRADLLRQHDVVHRPGLNEELAVTAVFGSQTSSSFPGARYDGVLGMWYGKSPGVDRAGDALKHANFAGVGRNGGVLALAGDDPNAKSSTLPNQSEIAFYDALIPVLYPGTVQEVLDLGLHGFMLSRVSGLWVGMKIATNIADGAGTVEVAPDRIDPVIPEVELDGRPFRHRQDVRLLPPFSRETERVVHEGRLELVRQYARVNGLNRITAPADRAWLGIMAAGKTYYDLRHALHDLGLDGEVLRRSGIRLLQVGLLWPLESEIIREFARGLDQVLVVEEKRPFLEPAVRDILYDAPDRPRVVGKSDGDGRPLLPAHGELTPDSIARAVAACISRRLQIPSVEERIRYLDGQQLRPLSLASGPVRTPYYCSGCPHNRSTAVPDGSPVGAGIGCHTMTLYMDPARYGQVTGLTQMGGEGAQWIGAAPFTGTPHLFQNLGDGTLFHSGSLAIRFAATSGVNITYKILYNSAVAMTGGQDAVGALPVADLTRLLETDGVRRIIVTADDPGRYRGVRLAANAEVWHRDRLVEAQRTLAQTPGVTALIHDQQCAAEQRRLRKRGRLEDPPTRVYINERACEGCGDCGRTSNCLSVQPVQTEFGEKTAIHQSSCNKDYSCLLGDCPSFMTVEPAGGERRGPRGVEPPDVDLPEPTPCVPADDCSIYMTGIGGTGVVTTNQILGTAAFMDGKHVTALDQTGLSQKGGPVVSHMRISREPMDVSNAVSAGSADLYLAFDLLVANDAEHLTRMDPTRTVAVASTSLVPTGRMVVDSATRFPHLQDLLAGIERGSRRGDNVYLDAVAIAEGLFGDHLPANLVALGAAYQAGAIPVSAEAIEEAIRLNGTAVDMNLAAFRWGRIAAIDPERVQRAVQQDAGPAEPGRPLDDEARALVEAAGVTGEARRLLEVRVPDLIAYQDAGYARRYVDFVRQVARAEAERTPGRTSVTEAVARYLYKLMAYKDEYEVARLHLDGAAQARLAAAFGEDVRVTWHLHPPLLRALGLRHKIRLGPWFTPGMRVLRAMKRLRGTPLDVFGYTRVRRTERALVGEYRVAVEAACAKLTPETHATVEALASLPDMVRGYEHIKLTNVRRYREEADRLLRALS